MARHRAVALVLLLLVPGAVAAQFADTEVSPAGAAEPFLVTHDVWTFEKIQQTGITYTIYESDDPRQGYQALVDGLVELQAGPQASWDADFSLLGDQRLHFYLVTANDGSDDNSTGSGSGGTDRVVELPPRCLSGGAPVSVEVPLERDDPIFFDQPMALRVAPGVTSHLFVAERPGRVVSHRLSDGTQGTVLDITAAVSEGGERGLLGMDFHPQFPADPRLFLYYSTREGGSCGGGFADHCARISSFEVSTSEPYTADPATETVLLELDQPFGNHNGGWIDFGPDGWLHIAFGDGGAANDPLDAGQDTTTLLAKILRIGVDPAAPGTQPADCGIVGAYAVPDTNPLVDGLGGACDEILHWGVRNPFRNGFDRTTGDLYVADVGQNCFEEVHVVPGGTLGLNMGWSVMEGLHCFQNNMDCTNPPTGCDQTGLDLPVHEYGHTSFDPDGGCSITGGYPYRGCRMPFLDGTYFYGEFCSGWIRTFRWDGQDAVDHREPFGQGSVGNLVAFGEDADGEIYVMSLNGSLTRIVPAIP